jgi:feruloyl esterase
MARTTRCAAAAFSLISHGIGAPLSAQAAATCTADAIAALNVPHFSVASVKADAAGGPFPARCVVDGTVATDGDGAGPNSARLRVQLPETWNGKLVFFGVGGLAGSLAPSASPHDFASALGAGYATAITDTGHVGKNPFDADWILDALGEPNEARIADYFYRAPHQATIAAKAIASRFYGAPGVSRAYFDGCSFGATACASARRSLG